MFGETYVLAEHSGFDAKLGEFPFMAAVFNGKNKVNEICAGIVLSEWIVLTAGYCVFE